MKRIKKNEFIELKDFLILWSTQSISQLGSSITGFALALWLYEKQALHWAQRLLPYSLIYHMY